MVSQPAKCSVRENTLIRRRLGAQERADDPSQIETGHQGGTCVHSSLGGLSMPLAQTFDKLSPSAFFLQCFGT